MSEHWTCALCGADCSPGDKANERGLPRVIGGVHFCGECDKSGKVLDALTSHEQAELRAAERVRLRDTLAAAAVQGLLANPAVYEAASDELADGAARSVARNAYTLADAMLAERDAREKAAVLTQEAR